MLKNIFDMSLEDIIARSAMNRTSHRASDESVEEIRKYLDDCKYSDLKCPALKQALCRLGASELEHTSHVGMIIKGDSGIGKSFGLELLAKRFKWKFVTALEVEGFYKTQPSYQEWERYCRACDFFDEPHTLVIDDLGTEKFPFIFYGQPANPLEEMLEIRYRISFCRDKVRTIVTTNLTDREIEERYGFRIADRINEMFIVSTFSGESYRSLK